jgi:hypothetical protein
MVGLHFFKGRREYFISAHCGCGTRPTMLSIKEQVNAEVGAIVEAGTKLR